jgi:hypothetical protein
MSLIRWSGDLGQGDPVRRLGDNRERPTIDSAWKDVAAAILEWLGNNGL